ncbi:MAG: hypothetical protein RDV48_18125 [Candidatus Eremiobacteraeota bacterium]|nr:hypothetical protein [Candidatus Eremiobacteraeota bacterium]
MKSLRQMVKLIFHGAVHGLFFALFLLGLPLFHLSRLLRRLFRRRPRILWGPTPIINIATNAAADRLFGYKSDTLVYETYYITSDFTWSMERSIGRRMGPLVVPLAVFLWACLSYDIFQFYFDGGFLGRTWLRCWELPLLCAAGKIVIVSTYGSDVRVRSRTLALGPYNGCMHCKAPGKACICDDEKASRNIAHVRRYAHAMLAMGDMREYVPATVTGIYFWAIDTEKVPYVGQPASEGPLLVLHAPNHPEYKGTEHLLKVIEELKREGAPIELLLVQKVSNREALELYKKAHIVAEQFLIGWYGYFAVESMALGKPVIAFIRKPSLYLPGEAECPIVSANPDSLKEALRVLIENPLLREELGEKGRSYVEKVHSLKAVGAKMDCLYRELSGYRY